MSASNSAKTSAYLQRCLDEPVGKPPNWAFGMQTGSERWVWEMFAPVLLDQYESVTHILNDAHIHGPRDQLELGLDDFLCRKFLREIPAMVDRVLKFDRLVTEEDPSDSVHVYFSQAMRCYVFGLPLAAVALAHVCGFRVMCGCPNVVNGQKTGLSL